MVLRTVASKAENCSATCVDCAQQPYKPINGNKILSEGFAYTHPSISQRGAYRAVSSTHSHTVDTTGVPEQPRDGGEGDATAAAAAASSWSTIISDASAGGAAQAHRRAVVDTTD